MLRNSFRRFHPDVPIFTFDEDDERYYFGQVDHEVYLGVRRLKFGCLVMEDYESVLLLGTDVVICDRLHHLLESAGHCDAVATLDIKRESPLGNQGDRYANADVTCVHSRELMADWYETARRQTKEYRLPPHGVNDWEQGVLNYEILPNPRYTVYFPERCEPVYYNHRSRWFWRGCYLNGGKLFAGNHRLMKSLHWNGPAGVPPGQKVRYRGWSESVLAFLSEVSGVNLGNYPASDLPGCSPENARTQLGGDF
jgi:hypothetical protein